jgi:hypothetical protein
VALAALHKAPNLEAIIKNIHKAESVAFSQSGNKQAAPHRILAMQEKTLLTR